MYFSLWLYAHFNNLHPQISHFKMNTSIKVLRYNPYFVFTVSETSHLSSQKNIMRLRIISIICIIIYNNNNNIGIIEYYKLKFYLSLGLSILRKRLLNKWIICINCLNKKFKTI